MLSIVIPCYNSELTLKYVVQNILDFFKLKKNFEFEIILVNDCSKDNTLNIINELCKIHKNIIGLDLARNFGQANALLAGFSVANGDYIGTFEDDGQAKIEDVWRFYEEIQYGYDIVCAKNVCKMKRSFLRKYGAIINRKMLVYFLDMPQNISPSISFVAKKEIINEMLKFDNPYVYIPGLILRTTKYIGNVEVQRNDRITGNSGYTFKKLFLLFFNGLTAFSIKPLRLASISGIIFSFIGFLLMLYIIIKKMIFDNILIGYTSILSSILLIGGLILLVLGIIGEYIGRIYMCINHNPQFIIRKKIN